MKTSDFYVFAALQWMIFLVILLQWHDRTVAEMLTSYNILPAYALIQGYLAYSMQQKFKRGKVKYVKKSARNS